MFFKRTLEDVLREAGTRESDIKLILSNAAVAESAMIAITDICNRFRIAIEELNSSESAPRVKIYSGKIDVGRLPEIVAGLRQRKERVTTGAISEAFGLSRTAFHHAMRKHPRLKAAYEEALASTEPPG